MPADRLAEVERLLDRVHAALMAGDLASLPVHVTALEALPMDGLAGSGAGSLARLRAKADRNARCLEAAGRGLRAAQRRLAEIRAAGQTLQTYDVQGQRQALGGAAQQIARRV
jgi:hypothetical protein